MGTGDWEQGTVNRQERTRGNVSSSALRQKGAQLAVTCAAKVKLLQFFVVSQISLSVSVSFLLLSVRLCHAFMKIMR